MNVKQELDKDIDLMHVMFKHDECYVHMLLRKRTKTKDVDALQRSAVCVFFRHVRKRHAIARNANM